MTTQRKTSGLLAGLMFAAHPLLNGCASTRCKLTKNDETVDLTRYSACHVEEATCAVGVVVPSDVLRMTGDRIASELRGRRTFDDVRQEHADGDSKCLRVRMVYDDYRPGSRMLRGILIGLGTAELKMHVELQDCANGRQLASGDVHEFWGFGGLMGMSRGIEDMQESAFTHVGEGINEVCLRESGVE